MGSRHMIIEKGLKHILIDEGKIVFGIEDKTCKVVGVKQDDAFRIMDGLTTSICDSCTPMITPVVTMASIDEKVVIIVTIQAAMSFIKFKRSNEISRICTPRGLI